MLKCPVCGTIYDDEKQVFCLNDGTALVRADNFSQKTVQYNTSPNQPTAAFNPQTASPAANQPKKKKNYFWILGGIGVLMFITFIGVLIVVGTLINLKQNGDNTNVSNVSTSPTPVNIASTGAKYEPELKMAINSANNAQSAAYANLDPSLLRNYYSGEALKTFVNDVETLKKTKIYQISTMQKQDFDYLKVNETGTEAEVRVTETWETYVYKLGTQNCLLYYPPTRTPQTVYLKKAVAGWMVNSTVYDTGIKKEPQACPKKK